MKKLFVLTYGKSPVSSVFGAKTLNVAVPFSTFSTLNTLEHCDSSVQVTISLLIGIDNGFAPDAQHEYIITGLVLHTQQVVQHPKTGLSHESKQLSGQEAFCCKMSMTCSTSAMPHVPLLDIIFTLSYLSLIIYVEILK